MSLFGIRKPSGPLRKPIAALAASFKLRQIWKAAEENVTLKMAFPLG
jgi:hypothetical protein